MTLLDRKVAIITGASSGIGRAAALLFAQQGAAVVLVARRKAALESLAESIRSQGGRAAIVAGDVRDEETHRRAVAVACETFGGLHIAFNNAGLVGPMQPLADLTPEDWSQVLAVNLTAAFLGARAQIPAMLDQGGGALVFTGSFVGNSVGLPGMSAYGAAKAGLLGLVRGITADYGAQRIRANALLPGGTATRMAGDADQQAWAASLHAMKRIAQPEEIAQAALFLASDMASFVTGSALWADGGNAAVKL
ncbi:NAD(P)-dependent dehydrogenase (short-subunit alcohol dehydrogenase family) [Sphingobium sp. B2D3A]|uniref:SDR family oxidoreductase n=1 Tax=unclassified Sphingobium TaxID=2611147 RepID=UPI0022253D6E|nr:MULTISPECIES: SDR family oxidoreductase [unclassified Sphingobium]MCW2336615.1 NAD(P)-dependent dehydrogenase (short-subunit alcohol dehydrogenase family) [Sphingobium sp. B2D3A]MCW2386369.1 NAD(P)-dependent dehydrogenase (short-subunit alcohol dehydrogenase family) [Sphingobium sp. B2D3D]